MIFLYLQNKILNGLLFTEALEDEILLKNKWFSMLFIVTQK